MGRHTIDLILQISKTRLGEVNWQVALGYLAIALLPALPAVYFLKHKVLAPSSYSTNTSLVNQ